jgi:hypothetical protein
MTSPVEKAMEKAAETTFNRLSIRPMPWKSADQDFWRQHTRAAILAYLRTLLEQGPSRESIEAGQDQVRDAIDCYTDSLDRAGYDIDPQCSLAVFKAMLAQLISETEKE